MLLFSITNKNERDIDGDLGWKLDITTSKYELWLHVYMS